MADKNKFSPSTSGHSLSSPALSPDDTTTENADDEDPSLENQDNVEQTLFIKMNAPPENRWYHGCLGRQKAEERLRTAGEVGCYLVRESESNKGSYVLSYLGKNGMTHFKISAYCGDYYIGGRRFDSLSLLIGYYTSVSYLLKEEQLKSPVEPPEPVDDKRKVVAIYPFSKMPETDELSFDKGDVFTVLNEMGNSWLWVKSQTTGEHGQIHGALVEDLNGNIDPDESLCYFHPNVTKEDAVEKLRQGGQGSFLVRPSENSPGNYSLFVLCDKIVQRFRIEKHERQLLMGGRYFDSLDGIIERYKKEEIVEGFTLVTPVVRVTGQMKKSQLDGSADDLYESIRNTSQGTFIGRTNKFDFKGFLHIRKGTQKKKWKNMFFVLIGSEKQLCYLENEKRSRPKGLIDLNFSSLYPVHDSFFGRPNCFQLITNANPYNHFQLYYLCAENGDDAQRWLKVLKPYCVNTQPIKSQTMARRLKELRTLTVEIGDAPQLPSKTLPHPYCIVNLNNTIKVCRTAVKEELKSYWEEKFVLEDIPSDVDGFSIMVYNQNRRSKDTEIAQIVIKYEDFEAGETLDKWYPLHPTNSIVKGGDLGSIRIRARYQHEIIMPEDKYSTLKELILNGDLINLLELFNMCSSERIPLAKALLQIFRHEKQEKVILKTMNDFEINREEEVSTLFRATSLATTLMDQYMKMTASQFVSDAVKEYILKIIDSKLSCELNPAMLEPNENIITNRENFQKNLTEMTESIFNSKDSCPPVLRYICGCLQKTVAVKWPSDDSVKTRVVSGFVFLRLLCPAILNPKSFNLITETPSETASRTLKLIAKALQNLANLVEFGAKESFMEVINPFIKKNKPRMVMFLDNLSVNQDKICDSQKTESVVDDLARDLATVHQICATHLNDLKKLSETMPSLKKLVAVTEILTDHKKRYMT
ncbi:ras GTPase-activating protein 1-like [Mytilus californianus]|uniref:ras GTPase-activating protein 1-like n=1 Tax=Mytilus californianus TaxID=6549 RepID=UPI0022481A22|nr:ras GTPase-activating protein 1-like [Mytilus californianus]